MKWVRVRGSLLSKRAVATARRCGRGSHTTRRVHGWSWSILGPFDKDHRRLSMFIGPCCSAHEAVASPGPVPGNVARGLGRERAPRGDGERSGADGKKGRAGSCGAVGGERADHCCAADHGDGGSGAEVRWQTAHSVAERWYAERRRRPDASFPIFRA